MDEGWGTRDGGQSNGYKLKIAGEASNGITDLISGSRKNGAREQRG